MAFPFIPMHPRFGARRPTRRSLPKAVYHVTTEANWRQIQADGVLKKGQGHGWTERQGVFALGWAN